MVVMMMMVVVIATAHPLLVINRPTAHPLLVVGEVILLLHHQPTAPSCHGQQHLLLLLQQLLLLMMMLLELLLLLLAHAGGKSAAESILTLNRCRRRDGCKLFAHGIAAVGSLDGVGGLVGHRLAAVAVGEDLLLAVQQVLAQLVGLGHLGAAQAFSARLAVLTHAVTVLGGPTRGCVAGVASNSFQAPSTENINQVCTAR